MKSRQSVQYTIRNVPAVVDQALRQQSRRRRKSLNHVAKEALARGAGVENSIPRYGDLDSFFGSWIEDSRVTRALAEQRKIDKSLWT